MELSKDKPSMKQVEGHTSQFTKTLSHVEAELSKHINYLSQVSTGTEIEPNSFRKNNQTFFQGNLMKVLHMDLRKDGNLLGTDWSIHDLGFMS